MKNIRKLTLTLLLISLIVSIIACTSADTKETDPEDAVWEGYDDVEFVKFLGNSSADEVEVTVKEGWGKSDELNEEDDLSEDAKAYTYTYERVSGKDIVEKIHFFMILEDNELTPAGCYNETTHEELDKGDTEDILEGLIDEFELYNEKKSSSNNSNYPDNNNAESLRPNNTTYLPNSGYENWLGHIEQENMDGYTFRILSRKGMVDDQYVEEETGDIVNDAVYKRNEIVKGYFNIDIVSIESSTDTASDAINSILAGDDQYDIMFPHSRTAFQYAVQDALVNFNDVYTIDTSKEWWSQDIVDSCNVNGNLYVLDGDISTHRLYYCFAMYFNKRIFDELCLEYPYQMALDGTWTFDEFSKLVKKGSKDLNGDGLLKQEDDQLGYYTREWFGAIQVLYSGNQRIYSKDARGIPRLSLNTPKTVQLFSDFFKLTDSDDVFMQISPGNLAKEDLFPAGRAMFADKGLGSAQSLRSMDDEFGILPWPKFSEEDEYETIVNGHASLMVMPITVPDKQKSGKIVEALCAIGNKEVIPAFYEVSLKTKFSRDAESEAMFDIIKDSIIYDLGYVSGGTMNSVGATLAQRDNHDFSQFYAQNESKAQSDLQNFLSSYGKM
ncbi:MAG: extracellular solute-binding protein [Ruminococcaceae bacterium]|nr:extracellular solute-binding protein [Oscillospiraceae bacterium]